MRASASSLIAEARIVSSNYFSLRERRLPTGETGAVQGRRNADAPLAFPTRSTAVTAITSGRDEARYSSGMPISRTVAVDHLRLPGAGRPKLDHPPARDRSGGSGRNEQRVARRGSLHRGRRIGGRSGHHPGRLGHERRLGVDRSAEHRPHAVAVGEERFHREVHVAVHGRLVAGGEHLRDDLTAPPLGGRARAHARGVQPGPQVPLERVLRGPPPQEQAVAALLVHPAVQLRREIVHPAVREPLSRIRIQRGVRVESRGDRLRIPRPPELERRDPELHPRFQLPYLRVQLLDELVDVRPPPVVARELSAVPPVCLPASLVGKIRGPVRATLRVRIEIVVEMHAVDVVALHHVEHHAQRLRAHRRLSRVHPELRPVFLHELRVPAREVRRRERPLGRRFLRAERIEPRVQFQSARVRLDHRELQGIPERHRRHPLLAREILGPRLDLRRVQRVACRPHLQDHGVEPERSGAVQQRDELGFRERGRQPRPGRPVQIADARHPDAAKFARHPRRNTGRVRLGTGEGGRRGARGTSARLRSQRGAIRRSTRPGR